MRRLVFNLFIISASVLWLAALVFPSGIAQAQVGTVWELIDAVNGVRTANGLPALEVDAALMSSAQATADIMASSGSCAHIGNASGRAAAADGQKPDRIDAGQDRGGIGRADFGGNLRDERPAARQIEHQLAGL